MTPDPYRASGGPADPGSWNRYAYVGGDPINFIDPEGLQRASLFVETPPITVTASPTSISSQTIFLAQAGPKPPSPSPGSGNTPTFRNSWEEDEYFGRPCREKPPGAPPGVDIDANIAEARKELGDILDRATRASTEGLLVIPQIEIGISFSNKVKTGGDWDFKKYGSQYEDFGNYHFGAVGAAIGFSLNHSRPN